MRPSVPRVTLLALVCLGAGACHRAAGIELTIASSGLDATVRDQITALSFSLLHDPLPPQTVPLSRALAFEERVLVQTPTGTTVQILLEATAADGHVVSSGLGAALFIESGERVTDRIVLGPGELPDLAGVDGFVGDLPEGDAALPAASFQLASTGKAGLGFGAQRLTFAELGDGHLMLVSGNTSIGTGAVYFASRTDYLSASGTFTMNLVSDTHFPGVVFTAGRLNGTPQLVVFDSANTRRYPWNGTSFDPSITETTPVEPSVLHAWSGLERRTAIADAWREAQASTLVIVRANPPAMVQYSGFGTTWQQTSVVPLTIPPAQTASVDVVGCVGSGCYPQQALAIAPAGQPTNGAISTRLIGTAPIIDAVTAAQTPAHAGLSPSVVAGGDFDGVDPIDYAFTDASTKTVRIALRSGADVMVLDAVNLLNDAEVKDARIAVGDLDGVPGDEIVITLPDQQRVAVLRWRSNMLEKFAGPSAVGQPRLVSVALDALSDNRTSKYDLALLHADGKVDVWRNQWP